MKKKSMESLKRKEDFKRVYTRGKSQANSFLVVYKIKNGSNENRIGYSISKKVGKSVLRNKIRRRLKEIYRHHQEDFVLGYDLVVIVRVRAKEASYGQLETSFLKLMKNVKMLP